MTIQLDGEGFCRPSLSGVSDPDADPRAAAAFRRICPGKRVEAPGTQQGARDPYFGRYLGVWRAHATDEAQRFEGSSGGVITALATWMVETGDVRGAVVARADAQVPNRTEVVTATDRSEILRAASSRYGPVANLSNADVLNNDVVVVGKPCEASALSAYAAHRGVDPPFIISFFCAGVPSQRATDNLVTEHGLNVSELATLRYRGRGWPGLFVAEQDDGEGVAITYHESWGHALGPTVQWRCKICPDGVGEAADVAVGDLWRSDERGYPVFDEAPGESVLIARTQRGLHAIEAASRAGTIAISPFSIEELRPVQPLQVTRRAELAARLLGARMAGVPVPRYVGYGLPVLALKRPVRAFRSGLGTFRRLRDRAR